MSTHDSAKDSPVQQRNPTAQQSPGIEFDETAVRQKLRAAIKLLVIFCSTYFAAAIIATRELKDIAGLEILGMPLALYTGLLVFATGVVVTRMCLNLDRRD